MVCYLRCMTIKIFKKVIVLTVEKASQYSLWWSFKKANWATNPNSVCKGYWCTWNGIIAWNGKWMEICVLNAP